MMAVEYTEAPQVANVAKKLIKAHHEHLEDVRIEYVFRSEAAKQGDKTIYGKARKISGLASFLAGPSDEIEDGPCDPFFVIEIAYPVWTSLDAGQREALVDHELSHCRTKVNPKTDELILVLAPHDLEEFAAIVERHGLWSRDVESFLKAASNAGQLTFATDDDPDE